MIYIRDLPTKGIAPFIKGWAGIEGWGGLTRIGVNSHIEGAREI